MNDSLFDVPDVEAPEESELVSVGRAVEFEPSVTITEEDFFDRGLQPLTLVVLQALWFLPQGHAFSPESLAAWFAQLGWKGGNGQPMSAKLLQRELRLLREAGFITATRIRGEKGRAAGIHYTVTKRASATPNPISYADGLSAKPQVAPQVANDHRSSLPPGGNGAKPQVAPQVANGALPPRTPPGGGGGFTSSPNPLTRPGDPTGHNQPAARAADNNGGATPEEIEAAAEWLQEALHAPFELGEPTARRYAPLLAERIKAQGWDLEDDLAQKLCEKPGGLERPDLALKRRIKELPRRRRRHAVTQDNSAPSRPADPGADYRHKVTNAAPIPAELRAKLGLGPAPAIPAPASGAPDPASPSADERPPSLPASAAGQEQVSSVLAGLRRDSL